MAQNKLSEIELNAAEFLLEGLNQAEEAEQELEFLATFLREYRMTRDVYTSVRDALAEHAIG